MEIYSTNINNIWRRVSASLFEIAKHWKQTKNLLRKDMVLNKLRNSHQVESYETVKKKEVEIFMYKH